jgi:anti-anti-sigma factor
LTAQHEQVCTTVDEPRPGVLVVHVAGMLDLATAPVLEARLGELLDARTPRVVVLDLGGTEFLGSAGVAVLLRLRRRTQALGIGDPHLARLNGRAHRTLHALGLLDQFVLQPAVSSA